MLAGYATVGGGRRVELGVEGSVTLTRALHRPPFGTIRGNAMAFQAVVNTVEVDVIYELNGEIAQNVFYAKFGGTYALANLQALADAVGTIVGSDWLPLQPVEAVFLRVEVRGLTVENDLFATSVVGAGDGEDIIEAYPNNVTFSVKKVSGFTGRSARGRSYWIGIPTDKTSSPDENHVTGAYRDDLVAAIDVIRTTINAEFNWDAVLVSRFSGGVKRAAGVTFDWVGSVAVDDRIDTQRGRLPAT